MNTNINFPILEDSSIISTKDFLEIFAKVAALNRVPTRNLTLFLIQNLKGNILNSFLKLFDTNTSFEDAKQLLLLIRPDKNQNYFQSFITMNYDGKQNLDEYFSQKINLGKLSDLNDSKIIEGLTLGMPSRYKKDLLLQAPDDLATWFQKATIIMDNSPKDISTNANNPKNKNSASPLPDKPCPRHLQLQGRTLHHWLRDCRLPPPASNFYDNNFPSTSTTPRNTGYNRPRQPGFYQQRRPGPTVNSAPQHTASPSTSHHGPSSSSQ